MQVGEGGRESREHGQPQGLCQLPQGLCQLTPDRARSSSPPGTWDRTMLMSEPSPFWSQPPGACL